MCVHLLYFCVICLFCVLQYFDSVGWVFGPVKPSPDNLYCVGGDVKPCSVKAVCCNCELCSNVVAFKKKIKDFEVNFEKENGYKVWQNYC